MEVCRCELCNAALLPFFGLPKLTSVVPSIQFVKLGSDPLTHRL